MLIADRVFYYDAIDDPAPAESDWIGPYLTRIEALPEVKVGNPGYLRRSPVARKREQKAVDVQLAVDALTWAFTKRTPAIAVVTGDGDFAPLMEAIRQAGAYSILLAFAGCAPEVAEAADRVITLPPVREDWVLK